MRAGCSGTASLTDSKASAKFQSIAGVFHQSGSVRSRLVVERRRGGAQRIPRPPTYTVGGPPPWAELAHEHRRLPLAEVRARLATFPPAAEAVPLVDDSVAAAVLVPLFEED